MTDKELVQKNIESLYLGNENYMKERQYPVTVLEKGNDIEVMEVLPISVSAVQGVRIHLPSASAVRTRDGRVLACFLEWDGGLEQVWDQPGVYQVQGRLRDTQTPAVCWVQVREVLPVEPLQPVKQAESQEGRVTLLEGGCFTAPGRRSISTCA